MRFQASSILLLTLACGSKAQEANPQLPTADGYRGIWYSNQPSDDEYRFKYSGGMATYPQQHHPIAYYSVEADKTFFTYGGTSGKSLLHMVAWFDHQTGEVSRPRILLDKQTTDAHDNPTLMIDDDGFIWIFSNAHGTARPSFIHRSRKPFSIDSFERVLETNFSYSQPWWIPKTGFCFLHTLYAKGRWLWVTRSADGRDWDEPRALARFGVGHYQVSWRHGKKIGTAFNYHPEHGGLNARTNLYYMESADGGVTWTNAAKKIQELPLTRAGNPALVLDHETQGLLVYLKAVRFDEGGQPILLYLTSRHFASGPGGDPRIWRTAHWTGERWQSRVVTKSDHNYDFGAFHVEDDGLWRLIAPTGTGPQPYNTGGEMVMWTSEDQGDTWDRIGRLTKNSRFNHSYARQPVNAHPDFYALWADGHGREPSQSTLYFATKDGKVFILPRSMAKDRVRPQQLHPR